MDSSAVTFRPSACRRWLHPVIDRGRGARPRRVFRRIADDRLGTFETDFVLPVRDGERIYMKRLRQKLRGGTTTASTRRKRAWRDRSPGRPASCRSSHSWKSSTRSLCTRTGIEGAIFWRLPTEITDGARQYLAGDNTRAATIRRWGLFRSDLLAQLLREYDQKQRYFGLGTFIHMSSGLPRNLVIILKNVFRWSIFDGEDPFGAHAVSLAAQREGVLQSANWFYEDAPGVGDLGREAQAGVDRVAGLMRGLRFADKPSRAPCRRFSIDLNAITVGREPRFELPSSGR